MIIRCIHLIFAVVLITSGCNGEESNEANHITMDEEPTIPDKDKFANVTEVKTSGSSGNYTFNVTISSPDTGCKQYADYWEVVSLDGELIYRRILLHSHVDEQPFTRSGGSVKIPADQVVWIRAHMNTSEYGGRAFMGSVNDGFAEENLPSNFAENLKLEDPLPEFCQF